MKKGVRSRSSHPDLEYTLGEAKLMVNVDSVGQPRDGDDRACYVILEDGSGDDSVSGDAERQTLTRSAKVVFLRLEYDSEITIRRIDPR